MKDKEILKEFERFMKKDFFNYLELDINNPRMKDNYPLWTLLTFTYEQRKAERKKIDKLIYEFFKGKESVDVIDIRELRRKLKNER